MIHPQTPRVLFPRPVVAPEDLLSAWSCGCDAALTGGPVCPVDDQAQGLVRGVAGRNGLDSGLQQPVKRVVRTGPQPLPRALDTLGLQTPRKNPLCRGGGDRGTVPAIPQRGRGTCSPAAPGHSPIWHRCSDLPSETRRPGFVLVGFFVFFLAVWRNIPS